MFTLITKVLISQINKQLQPHHRPDREISVVFRGIIKHYYISIGIVRFWCQSPVFHIITTVSTVGSATITRLILKTQGIVKGQSAIRIRNEFYISLAGDEPLGATLASLMCRIIILHFRNHFNAFTYTVCISVINITKCTITGITKLVIGKSGIPVGKKSIGSASFIIRAESNFICTFAGRKYKSVNMSFIAVDIAGSDK